jgi:hypothetical protein
VAAAQTPLLVVVSLNNLKAEALLFIKEEQSYSLRLSVGTNTVAETKGREKQPTLA